MLNCRESIGHTLFCFYSMSLSLDRHFENKQPEYLKWTERKWVRKPLKENSKYCGLLNVWIILE